MEFLYFSGQLLRIITSNKIRFMNSFLYRIANTFYSNKNEQISNLTFVFPNRRAGLFFRKYLSEITDKPLFSPEILTINECFAAASTLQLSDKLSNLFLIYRIYKKLSNTDESFDSFVFWGEMLLNDFDEVDKYLVDARQLFQNVTELNEIELLFNVLNDRQIEAIRQFWKNFIPVSEEKTKEQFIATWKVLYEVYSEFVAQLKTQGLGTEGMICREVAEKLKSKQSIPLWENKQFVFVGFNALNPCEKALMLALKNNGQADFYWDYESEQLRDPDNPASLYFAENTTIFPSKHIIDSQPEKLSGKKIKLVGIPSAVGMTKYVYATLEKLNLDSSKNGSWIDTAVVLPDESLLLPLLYAFPPEIDKINITMGYPLSSTPVVGLLAQIFELHRRVRNSKNKTWFYHKNVLDIIHHQYISQLYSAETEKIANDMSRFNKIYVTDTELHKNKLLTTIFSTINSTSEFINYLLSILQQLSSGWKNAANEDNDYQLECDFLQQFYITINRIKTIISENSDESGITIDTLSRIIMQLVAGISIPFVGEPLDGLQVMGVLESRGLDFENLIITSFNEGIFPKKTSLNSFIPYTLRRGFGLPTFEHHDAITSYNFYRLIHRAKNLYFVFDSRTEGTQNGEVSRYINQLNYHYGLNIETQTVNYDISFGETKPVAVVKNEEIMQKLNRFLADGDAKRYLSASSINTYINCPLQFYLTKIEQLNEADEIKETIEDDVFGTLFHAVMEYIYEPYNGQLMTAEKVETISTNQLLIDRYIRKAFTEKYYRLNTNELVELEGSNLLIANVLRKYVLKVLQYDKMYAPFTYIESERSCFITLPISCGNVNITGVIDRIDEKEGKLRVLDYKTGNGNLEFNNIDEVFEYNNDKRPKYILQTFLYGTLYKQYAGGKTLIPGIIYLRDTYKDNFSTEIVNKQTKTKVDNYEEYEDDFLGALKSCLEDIFNPDVAFKQSESIKPCEYCSYKNICNR